MTDEKLYLSRTTVRTVPCPACEAPAGERCVGARGKLRVSNHRERVDLAEGDWNGVDTGYDHWAFGAPVTP